MKNKNSITIEDVARLANCSTATVSRFINNPEKVAITTSKKIEESIKELSYRPNLKARALAVGSKCETICFLLCNRPFLHSIHADMLNGAEIAAQKHGVQIIFATCNYEEDIKLPEILTSNSLIDGIILAGVNNQNMINKLNDFGIPYVVCATNYISDMTLNNAIYTDDTNGGYIATKHLIKLGHKKIGFVGDIKKIWYKKRYEGYIKALNEAKLNHFKPYGEYISTEIEMGRSVSKDIIDGGFSAVFVAGDRAAIGLCKTMQDTYNLSIPNDLSIIGFNNEELSLFNSPALTTIDVHAYDVGYRALELIINKNTSNNIIEKVSLIERQSSQRLV